MTDQTPELELDPDVDPAEHAAADAASADPRPDDAIDLDALEAQAAADVEHETPDTEENDR